MFLMQSSNKRVLSDRSSLFIALILALVHGLIYVFIMPVWQHYDEPTHFEYAWLIANKGKLPSPSDYDLEMRRQAALSMIESGFFKPLGFLPDINSDQTPVWIGPISQLSNPPLYYLMGALPLRLLNDYEVDTQLIALRFVSLFLFIILIFSAWGIGVEITPEGHPLRFILPISVALLPGLTDVMTAANNDVAAVTFLSLCLWGCIRLIRRGFSWLDMAWCVIAAGLCLLSKETAYIALPICLLGFIFGFLRGKLRSVIWVVLGLVILIGGIILVTNDDAADWYRGSSQSSPTRQANPEAVEGDFVFSIEGGVDVTPRWSRPIFQPIPYFPQMTGGDRTFSLGAWIWASEPVEVNTPILGDGHALHQQRVEVGVEPAFYVFTSTVKTQPNTRLWVGIDPGMQEHGITVYYDGLVLAAHPLTLDEQPPISNPDSFEAIWKGEVSTNLIRNGSAEKAGLRIVHWADQIGTKILPDQTRPSMILTYFLDWKGALWHYRLTVERLLRTFWGQFGWGHINLIGHRPYRWLGVITAVSVIGFLLWSARRLIHWKKDFPWEIALILAFTLIVVWGGTASRGVIYLGNNRLYLPVARYAYPAIVPTMMLLSLGYLELFHWLHNGGRLSSLIPGIQKVLWLMFFIFLDVFSIVSIITYYHNLGIGLFR